MKSINLTMSLIICRANVELNANCQLAAKTTTATGKQAMPLVAKSAKAQFLSSRPPKNMLQRRWCSSSTQARSEFGYYLVDKVLVNAFSILFFFKSVFYIGPVYIYISFDLNIS